MEYLSLQVGITTNNNHAVTSQEQLQLQRDKLKTTFEMYLSLLTTLAFFFPAPDFGTSVQISFTFSKTLHCHSNQIEIYILQCLSKAFT